MAARPLAELRSEAHLRPPAVAAGAYAPLRLDRADVRQVRLITGRAGPRWRLSLADGSTAAIDARTGMPTARLAAAQAAAVAFGAYRSPARVVATSFIDRDHRPHEQREPVDSWQVRFDDGMRIYVDAWGGDVLAARSAWWRVYDKAWAIHIMDLQGRDDPNNPWIIMFGLIAAALVLGSLVLLPRATRRALAAHQPAEEA